MDILERRGVERIPGRHWISDFEERNSLEDRISRTKDQERAGVHVRAVALFMFKVFRSEQETKTVAVPTSSCMRSIRCMPCMCPVVRTPCVACWW